MAFTRDRDTWIVQGRGPYGQTYLHPPPGAGNQLLAGTTEVLISAVAQHPTATLGGAECHNCEHPQLRYSLHCPQRHTPALPESHLPAKRSGNSLRDSVIKGPVLAKGQ